MFRSINEPATARFIYKVSRFFLHVFIWSATTAVFASDRLRLATTTSTDNSGLLTRLHPPIEKKYGINIDVIAVGTGKALRLAENGDVDLVMVHAPEAEIEFVEKGFGIKRLSLMHNDFIVLGPANDPANLRLTTDLNQALLQLSRDDTHFISRGDDSGTHKKELSLWHSAGIQPQGDWYLAVGQSMAATLQIANDRLAYTLSDRATYLTRKHRIDLIPLFSDNPALFNPYHLIIVNPEKHPHVNVALAQKYVAFIRGKQGQEIIKTFTKGGEALFKPDVIR